MDSNNSKNDNIIDLPSGSRYTKIRFADCEESNSLKRFVFDIDEVEQEGIESLNIQETLMELRRSRMGLIQTPDQLRFCYQAVIEGTKRLDPNYVAEDSSDEDETGSSTKKAKEDIEERIYSTVHEEEAPPPPPPRAESLTKAPARPLPAIPASESLGNLNLSNPQESSSSDEGPPTPPARESSSQASSADDEDEEPSATSIAESVGGEATETVRRRRNRELAERVSTMKKRAREAERWHALKRFKKEDDNEKKPVED